MKSGLAKAILDLQRAKRGGQMSVMDFIGDADYLVDARPCAFDRIDKLVMDELAQDESMTEYDPEEDAGREPVWR